MKDKILKYIKEWEKRCYFDGIPEEVPHRIEQLNKAPSYRQICKAIMRNDYQLESLGFTKQKSKYYSIFKYNELVEKGKIKQSKQLKLF